MSLSSIGFGSQGFGNFPFGRGDWAETVLYDVIPEFYKDLDSNPGGVKTYPLRAFVDSIKPSFQDMVNRFATLPYMWSADETPAAQLKYLAYNVGISLTADKPVIFQRSEILNCHQLWLNKGLDEGYQIAGGFEQLTVTVTPLWAASCEPGVALSTAGPTSWMPTFDDVPADSLHLDKFYTDSFALWPIPMETLKLVGSTIVDDVCRSHVLELSFTKWDDTEIEDFVDVARRSQLFVAKMTPAHVTINKYIFDGPKSSSTYVLPVVSDNLSSNTTVMGVVADALSSASWTATVAADLVG